MTCDASQDVLETRQTVWERKLLLVVPSPTAGENVVSLDEAVGAPPDAQEAGAVLDAEELALPL